MVQIIYVLVILIATTIGALAGLGGGVIIKPVLDLLQYHDLATISFISTSAVFSMALYSIIKQIKNGIKIDWLLVTLISIGAAIGGNIGNKLFNTAIASIPIKLVTISQAIMLIILLSLVIISMHNKYTLNLKNKFIYLLVGITLGLISSFLGIGGGPINVMVFVCLFSIGLKQATIYSLVTILFSQGTKLLSIALTTGFAKYDLSILAYIIPAALVGGIVGSYLNKELEEEKIKYIFNVSIVLIIVINIIILLRELL